MKVYIAGPMRGMENLNREAFFDLEGALNALGHEAINPFALEMSEGLSLREYMKADLPALLDCDAVVVLDGWRASQGASLEVFTAVQAEIPVYLASDFRNGVFIPMEMGSVPRTWDEMPTAGMRWQRADAKTNPGAAAGEIINATHESILEEAIRITSADRQNDYGHPADHFARTIGAINAIFADKLREPFAVSDWPLILTLDKVSRESNKHKRDNLVDMAGYARTAEMVHERG